MSAKRQTEEGQQDSAAKRPNKPVRYDLFAACEARWLTFCLHVGALDLD